MTNEQIAKLARIAYENTCDAIYYFKQKRANDSEVEEVVSQYQKELDFIEPFLALENDERKDVR